jgi:hypothetical protein
MEDEGRAGKSRLLRLCPDDDISNVDVFAVPMRDRAVHGRHPVSGGILVAEFVAVAYNVTDSSGIISGGAMSRENGLDGEATVVNLCPNLERVEERVEFLWVNLEARRASHGR